MKIQFLGGARTVTGSCHLIETDNGNLLVDCGMHQGKDQNDWDPLAPFGFNPSEIKCVVLTHSHIDHSGLLPLLVKSGFSGKIYSTVPTADLCGIMLPDSGHIQEMDAEQRNRKRQRAGKSIIEPMYTAQDAINCMKSFSPAEYDVVTEVLPGVRVRFVEAGHLLGSSAAELWVEDMEKTVKIVFSGDVGTYNRPIIKDPAVITEADYVVMESTYGDRLHDNREDAKKQFKEVVRSALQKGGNLVIPSFAVGRTQELLYDLNLLIVSDEAPGLEKVPIYVDSPLAMHATEIFRKNYYKYYDKEAMALVEKGEDPLNMPNLRFSETADESRAINEAEGTNIIISSSGMCEAGRIRHHLKHNLWREDATVLFVGYQAENTLGRLLVDGAKSVKIFGEEIFVRARIANIPGYSGHADRDGLVAWVRAFSPPPRKVFVVHGESAVCDAFAKTLNQELGINAIVPDQGMRFDVAMEAWDEARIPPQPFGSTLLQMESALRKLIEDGQRAVQDGGERAAKALMMQKELEDFVGRWSGKIA
ncbi:MAG: MBL fold metallo-hydrolase RNA specificity domain-containing protein [Bacillota bacterium]